MTKAALAVTAALISAAAVQTLQPVRAQSAGQPAPFAVAATTVGSTSHAWIVDAGTRSIVHCRADNAATRACEAMPLPGPVARR
ncbi:MAG: hypothetical protein INF91_03085 [Alphaproteobacteria bacterium]|nr:hypothetical protein [Alphaproteobacteria bacterium]